jgi:hypothetical protein
MLFGLQESFAIEAMAEPDLKPPSAVWGRMRVWCQGVALGDFSEPYCALYPAYMEFKNLLFTLPSLWKSEFEGLNDEALSNRLDELLFGCHGDIVIEDERTLEQCQNDAEEYTRFTFLTNWGEQFDGFGKSFIFCKGDGIVRVINHQSVGAIVGMKCFEAPIDEVIGAISGFVEWFNNESLRLSDVSSS